MIAGLPPATAMPDVPPTGATRPFRSLPTRSWSSRPATIEVHEQMHCRARTNPAAAVANAARADPTPRHVRTQRRLALRIPSNFTNDFMSRAHANPSPPRQNEPGVRHEHFARTISPAARANPAAAGVSRAAAPGRRACAAAPRPCAPGDAAGHRRHAAARSNRAAIAGSDGRA